MQFTFTFTLKRGNIQQQSIARCVIVKRVANLAVDKLGAVIEREVLYKLSAHSASRLFLGCNDIVKSTLDSGLLDFTVTGSLYLLILKCPSPHFV